MRAVHAGSNMSKQSFTETSSSCLCSGKAVVRVKEKFQARPSAPPTSIREKWLDREENYNYTFLGPKINYSVLHMCFLRLQESASGAAQVYGLLVRASSPFSSSGLNLRSTSQPCSETRIPAPVTGALGEGATGPDRNRPRRSS